MFLRHVRFLQPQLRTIKKYLFFSLIQSKRIHNRKNNFYNYNLNKSKEKANQNKIKGMFGFIHGLRKKLSLSFDLT